ncbi:MAG: right-handed parallel beta-helix repeat-containing protein [Gemmatimonadales bacterium]|nr:right-handed parallel beta-helix repeat-containing protein [Gemmatimonadales bacterium]
MNSPACRPRLAAAPFAAAALFTFVGACGEEPTRPSEPRAAITAAGTVTLRPGASIQDSVTKYATGTTFLLKPGVYRLQAVTPKSGMSFIGEAGAVLSGARLLTSFSRQGSYWVASGQTQQGDRVAEIRASGKKNCRPEAPRCAYPEELWINNARLRHVSSLSAVASGSWYFDYGADKIYFAQDPTGRTVETSVTPQAFKGAAASVTIRALIIEKYANPFTYGAILAGGSGWLIENNQVRYNHGIGIETGDLTTARGNTVLRNLQLGMGGTGNGALIDNNEVAYTNNPQMIEYGWSAGGTKWHGTQNLTVKGNFIHHNKGPGLWTDIDNIYTLFEYNRVEDNARFGIYHEISYDAIIRYNTSARNGTDFPPTDLGIRGGGIAIRGSRNVQAYGNTLTDNRSGFDIAQPLFRTGKFGVYEVRNLDVHDNTVRIPRNLSGFTVASNDPSFYTSKNNRFRNNTYYLGSQARPFFWYKSSASKQDSLTITEWKAAGQDQTGKFIRP